VNTPVKPFDDETLYAALLRRDPSFEGVFFVAVTSTGIFCRPTCPAGPPSRRNCRFFRTAQEAQQAGFRACMRCRPLEPPNAESAAIRRLLDAVEGDPARRWQEADLASFGLHAATVRRHFQRRFGMTFLEYGRARRLGTVVNGIRGGCRVIDAQLDAGYESASGFRDAFARTFGASPGRRRASAIGVHWFDSPLGPIVVAGDERAVHCVEYADREGLDRQMARLARRLRARPVPGRGAPAARIEAELAEYFAGRRATFTAPLDPGGTPFQNAVWDALRRIPLGETRSYADIASAVGRPAAVRAAAQANGANPFAIVIPCHRVINTGGAPGGYGGGLPRKLWLLEHERRMRADMAAPSAA
jgi:AraC family transcriptional regulator of adaptative response/methylated-DNA-[protein]-cysteine methyltransferase